MFTSEADILYPDSLATCRWLFTFEGFLKMGWASYNEDIVSRWVGARRSETRLRVEANRQAPRKALKDKPANEIASDAEPKSPKVDLMPQLKDFIVAEPRPLPVIILADVSGSMSKDGKIDALNQAISNMLRIFAEEETTRAEIRVAVITFGGPKAEIHLPLTPAKSVQWEALTPAGKTPLGDALLKATTLIEDRTAVPSRAYKPTILLLSDGQPNDEWRGPLTALLNSSRGSKASRFAMAIGDDAEESILGEFLGGSAERVFRATDAARINQFFCFVTMSVAQRSQSVNPNADVDLKPEDLDDFEF
jgi:uncharacterized protein YegL